MNGNNNLRERLSEAEKIRKSARVKLRLNIIMFFVVYGGGIPLANYLWDSNRTVFYVMVIYLMLNVFLQLFIYVKVTSRYSQFVSKELLSHLVKMKFPEVNYEIDDSKKREVIDESRIFKERVILEEDDGYFHGSIEGFRFSTFRFYQPFREIAGNFSKIKNTSTVGSYVHLMKKGPKALSGLESLTKELPGVKKLLPEVPERVGVIPEIDEYYYVYSETEEAIRTALPESRAAILRNLAKERPKLKGLGVSFIGNKIFLWDDLDDPLYDLPSVKHRLTDSSPDVVFKGLEKRVNLLRQLRGEP